MAMSEPLHNPNITTKTNKKTLPSDTQNENGTTTETGKQPSGPYSLLDENSIQYDNSSEPSPILDTPNDEPHPHENGDLAPANNRKRKFVVESSKLSDRPVSPPWKKIAVDGPTSFVIDGRRKSSRTNPLPSAPPTATQKKRTRHSKLSLDQPLANGHASKLEIQSSSKNNWRSLPAPPLPTIGPTRRSRRVTASKQERDVDHENADLANNPVSPILKERSKKEPQSPVLHKPDSPTQYTRLRLRLRDSVITRQHPRQFTAPLSRSFSEWLASDNPLEEEKLPAYTSEALQKEACARLAIVEAAKPGGALFENEFAQQSLQPLPEPKPRYGPWDFITRHAVHFTGLMKNEYSSHTKNAARLAKAAKDAINHEERWERFREAKSSLQLNNELSKHQKKRYKQIIKDVEQMWLLVSYEAKRRKILEWEKEQEVLGDKALDQMLDQSTYLLQHRGGELSESVSEMTYSRAQSKSLSSDTSTEAGAFPREIEDSYISQSDDDDAADDADTDEDLTREQLFEKYSHLHDVSLSESDEDNEDSSSLDEDENENATCSSSERDDDDRPKIVKGESEQDSFADNEEEEEEEEEEESNGEQQDKVEGRLQDLIGGDIDQTLIPTPDVLDYSLVKVDDVDDILLDTSDEDSDVSGNMSDVSEEDEDAENSSDNDSIEEEEVEDGLVSLFGFYLSKKEILDLESDQAHKDNLDQFNNETAEDEDLDKLSAVSGAENDSSDMADFEEENAPSPATSIIPTTPTHHRIEPSHLLRGTLREYQQDGVDWLAKLYAGSTNGILADEMGLGKTIQTIALLAHLATHHHVWGPHLIVVPTSVILNWEMEFKKWCPGFRILTYYGSIEERKAKRRGWTNDDLWNVCITSYQLILQDAQAFKKRAWHYLVLDEAHNIKNFQTQRWQTLLTFRTHSRLLLTGTPLQNNLQELWSLFYFLMPAGMDGSGFAELEMFMNSMKKPTHQILEQGLQQLDAEAQARVSKLHEVLRPYLLRRLKSEVEKQMPGKYEHVVHCRLSKRQRQLYDEFMGRADTKRTLSSGNYLSIINCLMSLRKVCNHPDLFETRLIVTSYAMTKSVACSYEIKELFVRRRLLAENNSDNLQTLGLLVWANESYRKRDAIRTMQLQASRKLDALAMQERKRLELYAQENTAFVQSAIGRIWTEAQWNVVYDIERRAKHARKAADKRILFGKDLIEFMKLPNRFDPPQPHRKRPNYSHGDWFLDKCVMAASIFPTMAQIALGTEVLISKFGTVTPAVVAADLTRLSLTQKGLDVIEYAQQFAPRWDPYHEARVRLSIAFPDKRLLQYDCGKLQALDKLLRELQSGGHRCLVFTQMTKVLDILEQFLNIHGHKYLRLDGSTKIEQRQSMTDRFNNDKRILAFILSSRSGGLGINLTGADTVIFYDLDWNPAMDKQCQDRCHRIGQTRDVHIYRFVSEYTIEANILRKSNQKRLLDDVIIQKGDFTTDTFFNQTVSYRDALDDILQPNDDSEAIGAIDKVIGNLPGLAPSVLETAEDKEDAAAAEAAQKEINIGDDIDFNENIHIDTTAGAEAISNGTNQENQGIKDVEPGPLDEYLLQFKMREMKNDVVKPLRKGGRVGRKKTAIPDWKR